MPAPGDMGTASLTIRTDRGLQTIILPPITSIDTQVYANLSELPTVVLGYENNFCMDLGTYQKISLTMKRVNPRSYNDNSSDMERWSNGKYYRELEKALNFWQNFGRDPSTGAKTGGFIYDYSPSDTTLYPRVHKNAFLNGALSVQYSKQYMVIQMNLTIARMEGGESSSGSSVTITLHSEDPDGGSYSTQSQTYSQGVSTTVPRPPNQWTTEWGAQGYQFMGWATSSGGSVVYATGTMFTPNSDMDLYAVWSSNVLFCRAFTSSDTYVIPNYNGSVVSYTMTLYLVGGGGGAGGTGTGRNNTSGGGGGSGAYRVFTGYEVTSGQTVSVTIGAGGAHGDTGSEWTPDYGGDGKTGGTTSVSFNGNVLEAEGGSGGKGGKPYDQRNEVAYGGAGGSPGGYKGGDTKWDTAGGDGGYSEGGGIGGKGFPAGSLAAMPGAGGGACDLNITITSSENGTIGPFRSKGGDGGGYDGGIVHATEAQYGGGGGSDPYSGSTNGANGIVIIALMGGTD